MNNENNFIPPDFFDKKVKQTRQELYLYIEEPSDIPLKVPDIKEENCSVVIDFFSDENE